MGDERKTLAVVIRTADYKDNDKMLTLLTKEYGRMSANVRGAKKQTSKLFSAASLFCCGDYIFYEKSGRFGVKGCDIRRTFFGLQNDYDAFSAACFIADAVDKTALEDDVSPGLFSLTVHALYALDTKTAAPLTVLCYFLQRLLYIEGVYPNLSCCVVCGSKKSLSFLSADCGGAVCENCVKKHGGAPMNGEFVSAMRRMAGIPPKDIGTLSIEPKISKSVCAMLIEYFEYMLQRPLKTARFVCGDKRRIYQGAPERNV
ncbi:MAG: DNA repair protein RecO [Christensenellales bacterium]